jgi:mxaA protein
MARALVAAWVGVWLGTALPSWAAEDSGWRLQSDEPRAFGHQVGEVVTRRFVIETPPGRRIDRASLPQVGRRGKSLELRAVRWREPGWFDAQRYTLELDYQVFVSPPEVRTLEMPPVMLRFDGGARSEELRLDAWPLTVAPLVPREPSPRTGLGELRPDAPAPAIDTRPALQRLAAMAVLALLALAYLAQVYLVGPWWRSRLRPFALAWGGLRGLGQAAATPAQRQAAYRLLHRALDGTAGEVVFERSLPSFLAAHPRYQPLQAELAEFFQRSRAEFFGTPAADDGEALRWLRALARRCRDLERGAA